MVDNSLFVKSLQDATAMMVRQTVENMETACLVVERTAKQKCKVDIGLLRASIQHDVDYDTSVIVGTIFSSLSYAPYVEKGTGIYAVDGNGRKTPWSWGNKGSSKWPGRRGWVGGRPYPFLEPARDANKDKVAEILAGKGVL